MKTTMYKAYVEHLMFENVDELEKAIPLDKNGFVKKRMSRAELKALNLKNAMYWYYAHLEMRLAISSRNGKTGYGVLTIGFPAWLTCNRMSPCASTCYAMRGAQGNPTVAGSYMRNYLIYLNHPNEFFSMFYFEIMSHDAKKARVFDSGDCPTLDFFERLCKLARKAKTVEFSLLTKQYDIVNSYLESGKRIPKNLMVKFSAWDKGWEVPNPFKLATAYISFDNKTLNPEFPKGTFVCPSHKVDGKWSTTCTRCGYCYKNDGDVIFKEH